MEPGAGAEELERELVRDLDELRDDLHEDEFARELYRGLASHRLTRLGNAGRAVSLSWRRAEEVVNGLRERVGEDPLTLAELGWRAAPLDTASQDPSHVSEPPSPRPQGERERDAPSEPPKAWREAHEEADRP